MTYLRYTVQMMCWPNPQYAVWDRVQRREVSWLSTDRKAIAAKARAMNAAVSPDPGRRAEEGHPPRVA